MTIVGLFRGAVRALASGRKTDPHAVSGEAGGKKLCGAAEKKKVNATTRMYWSFFMAMLLRAQPRCLLYTLRRSKGHFFYGSSLIGDGPSRPPMSERPPSRRGSYRSH